MALSEIVGKAGEIVGKAICGHPEPARIECFLGALLGISGRGKCISVQNLGISVFFRFWKQRLIWAKHSAAK